MAGFPKGGCKHYEPPVSYTEYHKKIEQVSPLSSKATVYDKILISVTSQIIHKLVSFTNCSYFARQGRNRFTGLRSGARPEESTRLAKEEVDRAFAEVEAVQAALKQMPEGEQKEAARKEVEEADAKAKTKMREAVNASKKSPKAKKNPLQLLKKKAIPVIPVTATQRREQQVPPLKPGSQRRVEFILDDAPGPQSRPVLA